VTKHYINCVIKTLSWLLCIINTVRRLDSAAQLSAKKHMVLSACTQINKSLNRKKYTPCNR